jgi:nitrogen fixation NifU-like protein
MMTTELKGKSAAEAERLFDNVHKMLTGEIGVADSELEGLGKLKILSGVCKFPARVKCASLAWHTVNAALKGTEQVASTE